jgi:RNA polymerase sigma-70 factor (ECF subfamily)
MACVSPAMGLFALPLPHAGLERPRAQGRSGSAGNARQSSWKPTPSAVERTPAAPVEELNALVRRCLQGDGQAWRQIVESQHRRVYGLCYRFTGSASDAEDLTQDVFLKVYRSLQTFDVDRGSFQSWLTALTRNLLVDHFRRTRAEMTTGSLDAGWEDADGPAAIADRIHDAGPSPLDNCLSREVQALVQQALLQVSPELREAVILRDLKDMDYKEIAEVLRIPEGTVKSRISRGRMELARLLERNRRQVM